jgi:hypothetical protein
VITGPATNAILFCILSLPWVEKLMLDNVNNGEQWTRQLNISNQVLRWYHNNEEQKNDRGYTVRLFAIYTEGALPGNQQLVALGRHIAAHLNAMKGNDATVAVDPNDFFWLPHGAVWSDVIGTQAALTALFKATHTAHASPGYFEANRELIHSYFHRGTLSSELATILYAPDEELHPSLRAAGGGVPAGVPTAPLFPQVNLLDDDTTDAADNNDDADSFIDNGSVHNLRTRNWTIDRLGNDDAGDNDSYNDDEDSYAYSDDE